MNRVVSSQLEVNVNVTVTVNVDVNVWETVQKTVNASALMRAVKIEFDCKWTRRS